MNNKGFTLVELLAVLVILITIMLIAIPSITSSLERSKNKQLEAKIKIIESAAELYVSDKRNQITTTPCYIELENDLVNKGYLTNEDILDSDGNLIVGYINYNSNTISFSESSTGNKCIP